MVMQLPQHHHHKVNFTSSKTFASSFISEVKEILFPDDPFRHFYKPQSSSSLSTRLGRTWNLHAYFLPMLRWLPKYTLSKFQDDLVAGITIASVTIPQSICHARLTHLPPIIGLYSCFIPPLIYSIFGSSKNVAIGTVASASILSASIIGDKVSPIQNPDLYLRLVFTSTFFAGIFQTMLGIFRLGILVDFLSKSTILGFMSGTATIIILQQCKGMLGLTHFTIEADAASVVHSLYHHLQESSWQTFLIGLVFICFLLLAKYIKHKNPKLFWLSAMAPPLVMLFGGLFAYLIHAEDHGIPTVGPLKKGLNPFSIGHLTFNNHYLGTAIKAGIVTGSLALAEGIAVGRSLALMNNDHVDGNKEMIAFGMMNIVGSFTSCYLTTAPFSKSAVNYDYGCKTAMSNVVMAICIMLVLLFLGPFFRYTPLVSLASMILLSTSSLIKLKEIKELFKIDKFDFCICIISFLSVVFISMDIGLLISVSISVIKILLNAARPRTYKLGRFEDTTLYQDVEQYPSSSTFTGILVLRVCSPLFFANASYLRERIKRWVESELDLVSNSSTGRQSLEYLILDISGVTSIDKTSTVMLSEVWRYLTKRKMKLVLIDPRIEVMEKLVIAELVNLIGKEHVFISIDEAIRACQSSSIQLQTDNLI